MAHAVTESVVATESRLTIEGELARRITIEDSLGLVRLLGIVAAARDAHEVCRVFVERGLFGRPLELCALACYDEERGGLELLGSAGPVPARGMIPFDEAGPLADAVRCDALVEICDDAELEARYPSCPHRELGRILVAMPLRTSDRIVGALGARFARRSELTCPERAMLLLLASRLGPVLERCAATERERRVHEELELSAKRFYAMARISRELAEAGLDEHAVLERAACAVADVFGDTCLIRLQGEHDVIAWADHPVLPQAEIDRLVREARVPTPALGTQRVRTSGIWRHESSAVRSSISAPLSVAGVARGVILVLRQRDEEYSEADRLLLDDVSHRVGLALAGARAYAEVQEARERAERAARGRDRVLSAVTHDLRAPLATVHLGASLLADIDRGENAYADIVNRIARATGRMRRLVEDLLDLGQLESGVLRVHRGRVPLARLLADTADELQERARGAQKELACAPPAEPVEVLGDAQRLQQVLVNLVVNAIDHTPPGTWIVLGADVLGEHARIWVEDDGPGISQELVEHLFEPYVRGSRASAHGAGLGLWIAKGIVEAHGSELVVTSAPDAGTRFEMLLPIAASD